MANTLPIIPKRTSVAGRLPDASTPSSTRYIRPGEISINLADQKMYTSNGSQIFEIGANLTNLSVQTITASGSVGSAGQHLMFDGSQIYWSDINLLQNKLTVSSIEPQSPALNDIWIDTN